MKTIAIIGGGVSGLAALHLLRTRHTDTCIPTLFEREDRLGGTVGTDRIGGFQTDWGPNGFLDKVPLTLQIVSELGLDDRLAPASPKAEKRFIYHRGQLNEISASPPKFLASPLLSAWGRLRLIAEPFIKQKKDELDESVFDFAARRIGKEAASVLIDPMVSGIFGGDASKLSLKACFPVMVQMERKHGSLFRALIARKRAGSKGGPAGPAGHLTSFKGGLYTLIERFRDRYAGEIKTTRSVSSIAFENQRFVLSFANGATDSFDAVICSTPAYDTAELLRGCDADIASVLDSIPYASIAVVSLGFERSVVEHPVDGFGFLVPRSEKLRILGSIWTSSIFPDRCPEGMVQFRTMIGGATDPEAVHLSDGSLLDIVTSELAPILTIKNSPTFFRVFKYERGIPQFILGHPEKVRQLETLCGRYPGLQLAGNAYEGIGLNDCVLRAEKVVTRLIEQIVD
jgi:oxygen-dependent protoporphyrinogen oxidase